MSDAANQIYMDTNLYWCLRGPFSERTEKLEAMSKEYLEAAILDTEYNDFLRSHADLGDDEDIHGHGKRLPYIGWFWRHLRFHSKRLPIGNCGSFIGFIENNKWDYPQRHTTEDEFASIIAIVDEAMRLDQEGGQLSEIVARRNSKLNELWPLLQMMTV